MRRIGLASAVMSSLKKVWNNRQLNNGTKAHVYRASETWTLLAADIRRLEAFHMRCLRQLLKITWQNHITNETVLATTGLTPLQDILSKRRASLFGRVARLNPDSLHAKPYHHHQGAVPELRAWSTL